MKDLYWTLIKDEPSTRKLIELSSAKKGIYVNLVQYGSDCSNHGRIYLEGVGCTPLVAFAKGVPRGASFLIKSILWIWKGNYKNKIERQNETVE